MNTHTIVVDMQQNLLRIREDTDSQNRVVNVPCTPYITE